MYLINLDASLFCGGGLEPGDELRDELRDTHQTTNSGTPIKGGTNSGGRTPGHPSKSRDSCDFWTPINNWIIPE